MSGSYGENHPEVAGDLNNLAQLLQSTNRPREAEPLSRRMVEIFLTFTRETGRPHPHLQAAVENHYFLLEEIGHSEEEIQGTLKALGQRFGVDLA